MKNNRTKLNEAATRTLMRNLGDPGLLDGRLGLMSDRGTHSIIELDIRIPSHIELYEELKNNPDKYIVVQEKDYASNSESVVRIRYVRKGPWKPKLPPDLDSPSSKRSSRSSKKKEEGKKEDQKIVGFGAAVKQEPGKSPPKKKAPARRKKKVPAKKKSPSRKKVPAKQEPSKKMPGRKKKESPKNSPSPSSEAPSGLALVQLLTSPTS